ncbi:protein fem-1 homolog A-like [Macrobrachium nipponense]|uniref:protein fem-1 homolog A-like n=1 Tax=Macrobrachium nipponense TaxID=159736 RepID=UPI0030C8BF38
MAARDCNGCKSHGQTFPSGVKYCVERVKEGRDSILCTAALLGHTNCVRILVEYRGADVEELGSVSTGGPLLSGVSPLWCAAFEEHYWVVAYLLSKGANPNGDTSFYITPLQAVCELGYFHIVRLLVEHGAYIDAADNRAVTCLMLASFGGHLEIVKYLLEVGADVNSKNIEGESALHACAKEGHLEVMKLLLEHNAWMGADYFWYVNGELIHPKTQDNFSCPSDGDFSEVNTLEELEKFEEIEDPDLPMPATPRAEVVNLLLETGSDPSATDNEGNTPLHAIAKNEECPKGIVDALLSRGAHLDAKNGQGQTFASLRADQGQPVSQ